MAEFTVKSNSRLLADRDGDTFKVKNAKTINDYGRLVADVYYKGKNLVAYFPVYKT